MEKTKVNLPCFLLMTHRAARGSRITGCRVEKVRILVQKVLEGIQVLLDGDEQVIVHVQLLKAESTVQRARISTS